MIVVDPRFTRTAAVSDLFVQIRAGADIAFLGGLMRYAIENNRIAHDYLLHYTNAAFLVDEHFKLPEEDGVFSGFNEAAHSYDQRHLELRIVRTCGPRRRSARHARQPGVRSDSGASALRLPAAEEALLALHA